jgi:DNA repair exonuclease SbcCD ATPase subunit
MLKHLSYSVTFPSTGRTLAADVAFRPGFGVITGPNESGKTAHIEQVRFCLFGSAALRGKTEDYKSLKSELDLSIRGESYRICRTINSARLFRGKEEIAVGVRPVNEKLLKILGFGLDVFDVACVANQGEIERLGAMKPTERKRMVDTVVGLSLIDELARWAGEEALSLFREAEAIERTLVAPVEPEQPDGYRPSCGLEAEIADLQRKQERLSALEGWLSHVRDEPLAPKPPTTMTAAELKLLADRQTETRARRRLLEAELASLPAPSRFPHICSRRSRRSRRRWIAVASPCTGRPMPRQPAGRSS